MLVSITRGNSGGLRRKKAETVSVEESLRRRSEPDCGCRQHSPATEETGILEKERNMRSALRRSTMLLAIAITAPLISGCVGWRDEVAAAQSTANQALSTAQAAQGAASGRATEGRPGAADCATCSGQCPIGDECCRGGTSLVSSGADIGQRGPASRQSGQHHRRRRRDRAGKPRATSEEIVSR